LLQGQRHLGVKDNPNVLCSLLQVNFTYEQISFFILEEEKMGEIGKQRAKRGHKSYLIKFGLPAIIFTVTVGYILQQFFSQSTKRAGLNIVEDLWLYQLKETRPTLAPALFRGKIARVYQIALEIPKVLDQLHCYCRCKANFGHKTLLSCYVDYHAAN